MINDEGHQEHLLSDALRFFWLNHLRQNEVGQKISVGQNVATLGEEQLELLVGVHRCLNVTHLSWSFCVCVCSEHTQYYGCNQWLCICNNWKQNPSS